MPRIPHLSFVLAMSFLGLGGCTTLAMQGMNGIKSCPAGLVAQASTNMYILDTLQPGDLVNKLTYMQPAKVERMQLLNGSPIQTLYYKTGDDRCRGMPTETEFTPVVTAQNGEILGIGYASLQNYSGLAKTTR